ncbi:MAG: asparagine synthase (glutamine-hydrolyzing) [Acidobacteria bacterium]|nr:MAG: asparagine synthase (glutamine-hydrolyzing) [Acidobacteriota bacterium]REK01177.1 MAG: asparagine synthase (glutamine-hydrolyzing) [Acidobacteriota bacterium]REK14133.1 MAG: asparagine synthase (glutamine-hydrolyzing) [Acidobacteriota bacterium]REK44848.1 MAG: asparagine synthase (glutamine-hydrolyzing) [Acidobacteriota bacterium]
MCGIAGILNLAGQDQSPERSLVERMTGALTHRGPDDTDIWISGPVGLGHQRLSIIDLSSLGRQPMTNEDSTVHISYNGEIYNFRELKETHKLIERGHKFRSRTDTEVLVHLYEELGIGMLPELDGMFAFALWDSNKGTLHLARDRFGIKPLFYTVQNDRLLFASEIKALLRDNSVPRRVNLQAMHDFLTFNYIPGDQTAFEGIYELPPAHLLTIKSDGGMYIKRYWKPEYKVEGGMTEETAVRNARRLMESAVRKQLVADVPVGVLLSGGMDSSALTALMSREEKGQVHTYSVGFEDESFNELPYARIVAEACDTVHKEVVVTPSLVRDLLPSYLSYIDEPYADGSAIPTYYVCGLAVEDVKVVLSGEGGDEVFAGYETHAAYKVSRLFRKIPGLVRNGMIKPLVNLLPVSNKKLSLEFKMKRFLGGQDLSVPEAHLWWRIVLTELQKSEIYSDRVLNEFSPLPSARFFQSRFDDSNASGALNKLLEIDSGIFLPDDLMIKNDRMSMAHSLEARVPMTDNELFGFMETVPEHIKLKGMRKKNVMREALKGLLPDEILIKKKVGLEMPYSKWLKHELKDLLDEYLSSERISDSGLFDPDSIKNLIDQHLANQVDHGRALWGLLNFMMWLELYIPDPGDLQAASPLEMVREGGPGLG